MQPKRQSNYEPASVPGRFKEWSDFLTGLATFPALTLMVFIHSKVGFRRLKLGSIFGTGFALYLFNAVGNFHIAIPMVGQFGSSGTSDSLEQFGLVFMGIALYQRHNRWKELLAGVRWHGYSAGVSRLSFLPIREDYLYRFVEPALAFLGGLCLRKLGFSLLGLWVMLSAVSLRIVAAYAHEKALERDLDTLDGLLEADEQARMVTQFSGEGTESKARSLKETGGIPTGADANLEAVIARRRQENTAASGTFSYREVRQ